MQHGKGANDIKKYLGTYDAKVCQGETLNLDRISGTVSGNLAGTGYHGATGNRSQGRENLGR